MENDIKLYTTKNVPNKKGMLKEEKITMVSGHSNLCDGQVYQAPLSGPKEFVKILREWENKL